MASKWLLNGNQDSNLGKVAPKFLLLTICYVTYIYPIKEGDSGAYILLLTKFWAL